MDLSDYRSSPSEKARIGDLMDLLPDATESALDIGARDGFLSKLLANQFLRVTALDLEQPVIDHERILCVKGNITALEFESNTFDLVFCAEVLEHIPPPLLEKACAELGRVSKVYVLIGVPYQQDTRVGRTTCGQCGKFNPPWGHVNSFDERRLAELFSGFSVVRQSFVGTTSVKTNALSSAMMDLAGNPYGTYSQDEPCVHCGGTVGSPVQRNIWQKALTKAAVLSMTAQQKFVKPHGNWIHQLLRKRH